MNINIAMAFNEKYSKYAYVTMLSVLKNKEIADNISFYLLHSDVTLESQKQLSRLADMYHSSAFFIFIDKKLFPAELPFNTKISLESYFRLFLAEQLPADVDRIIYLDTDMIVNKPLNTLYSTNFENCRICACEDFFSFEPNDIRNIIFKERLEKGFTYICAGMMLMNIDALRDKYDFNFYMSLAEQLDYRLVAHDQDLINYAHYDRIKVLDKYEYNLFANYVYEEGIHYQQAKCATIVHFAGYKPWSGKHIHIDTQKLWWDYAIEAPFSSELMKSFIIDCLTDSSVYEQMTSFISENNTLKQRIGNIQEELKLRTELNEKLLKILN